MNTEDRKEFAIRDRIMKLLSSDELARVSNAETAPRLADGDEYIDLEHLDRGVRRAPDTITPMGRVLTRKAVHPDTWKTIIALCTAGPAPPNESRA